MMVKKMDDNDVREWHAAHEVTCNTCKHFRGRGKIGTHECCFDYLQRREYWFCAEWERAEE